MLDFREFIANAEMYTKYAQDAEANHLVRSHIVVATILAWCGIEAFVNSRLEDFAALPPDIFELHERGLLLEKQIRFIDKGTKAGTFELIGTDYKMLEHKMIFLVAKFGQGIQSSGLGKGQSLWQSFEKFKEARNSIIHPRSNSESMTIEEVEKYVEVAKEIIRVIAQSIWKEDVKF